MSYIEKFWRPATAADIARVVAGERAITARFRNAEDDLWQDYYLSGVNGKRWLGGHFGWTHCQVYDPPQWFLDKPDPGEGYGLLGKFPDEDLQPGDEALWPGVGWKPSERAERGETQLEGYWYRRRIEQPKPEPKYAVGQRVRVVGGVCSQHVGLTATITDAANNDLAWSYFVKGGVGGWFREDCLEPVVEPEPKHYTLQVGDTCDVPSGHRITITEHGVDVS